MFPPDKLKNFDNHRQISWVFDNKTGLKAVVCIHRGGLMNPAFGATRIWPYPTLLEAVEDGLKLSRVMSYKSAISGLKYGGAKAVIVKPSGQVNSSALMRAYCQALKSFQFSFLTGADLGIGAKELKLMSTGNRNVVGLHSDPVKYTALGVYYAIQTTLKHLYGSDGLEGRSFSIQGLGKTGWALLEHLYPSAEKIYISDLDKKLLMRAQKKFPKVTVVSHNEIYQQKVDIFSPCATSNSLNQISIAQLAAQAVVGSANGQLESASVGQKLFRKGILYSPDYVVNAGGLITVVDEYENQDVDVNRIERKVNKIKKSLDEIITKSKRSHKPTNEVADKIAEKIITNFR